MKNIDNWSFAATLSVEEKIKGVTVETIGAPKVKVINLIRPLTTKADARVEIQRDNLKTKLKKMVFNKIP